MQLSQDKMENCTCTKLENFIVFMKKMQKRFSLFAFNLWKKMSFQLAFIPISINVIIFALEIAFFGLLGLKKENNCSRFSAF